MKQYELSYLISPDLTNEEVVAFGEKINSILQDNGAVLGKLLADKKVKLGHPIKKNLLASIKTINFHLSPDKIVEIEKMLKEKPEILRYFILCPKKIKAVEKELVFKTSQDLEKTAEEKTETLIKEASDENKETSVEETPVEEVPAEDKKEKKAELEDIDAKLKEILDEQN
jgi:ribosomal protein S6